jgi:hypothetical protein
MRTLVLAIGAAGIMVTQAAIADERLERSLHMLALPERLEQLCGYTAMQRIRQGDKNFRPDRTVANAISEPREHGDTLEATGGAFRSRGKWYALSYTCTTTPDRMAVTSFHYTIGAEIPETKWAGYGLWQ